jgi:hypothetical protein
MPSSGRDLLRGAGAGTAATLSMTLAMIVAKKMGALGKEPPRRITDRTLIKLRSWPSRERRRAIWIVNHFAFGAGAGVIFSILARRLGGPAARVIAGAVYGMAVWASMYGQVLPSLGLMPRPARDRPGRPASMAISHVVYGVSLGTLLRDR